MTDSRVFLNGARVAVGVYLTLVLGGCIKAPDVVLVDRHTLLEAQASGRLPQQEAQLAQAGISPGPAAFTPGQLERSGWHSVPGHDAIAALYASQTDDASVLEQWLVRRCVGEANDGTLIPTPDVCSGAMDAADVARRLERANRNRRQVWAYLQGQQKRASEAEVRDVWRTQHRQEAACGAWWQKSDGIWEQKPCP